MRAVTVGSAMIDILTLVDTADVERVTFHNVTASFLMLEQGRKFEAESISRHVGGGAVNAAVAMRRLGWDTAVLAKLGTDPRAAEVVRHLDREGVGGELLRQTGGADTGTAVIVASHDSNATIFTHRGANTLLTRADFEGPIFRGADLVYIAPLSGNSAACLPAIVRLAREAGAEVAVNPGIRQLATRPGPLLDNLGEVRVLSINTVEAARLLPALADRCGGNPPAGVADCGKGPELMRRGLVYETLRWGLDSFLNALLDLGVSAAVVTDGRGGAYIATADALRHCPVLACSVAGTAGAGDAFTATFAAEIVAGLSVEKSLRFATVNAASVLGEIDTQSGLLDLDTLDAHVAEVASELPVQEWAWR